MKYSAVFINKKSNAVILGNGDCIETALMGVALIKKSSETIAKERKITIEEAKKAIIDSIMESK